MKGKIGVSQIEIYLFKKIFLLILLFGFSLGIWEYIASFVHSETGFLKKEKKYFIISLYTYVATIRLNAYKIAFMHKGIIIRAIEDVMYVHITHQVCTSVCMCNPSTYVGMYYT